MLMTTTNTLQNVEIKQYLGIVSGEAILGANLMKDIFASVRDIVGGRSGAYEAELLRAKETAMHEMETAALAMGANAIIGIDLDYESLGSGGSMLMVCASGTAVLIQYTTRAV
jgi:uncharacterized protein YbjQ (UPF0145 family)